MGVLSMSYLIKWSLGVVLCLLIVGCSRGMDGSLQNLSHLASYNVVWNEPGNTYYDSMPVGNGDIGLNVWTEPQGDIGFYIGKTDSWGANGNLKKVGKVRIVMEPVPVSTPEVFTQELDLLRATWSVHTMIEDGQGNQVPVELRVMVDANHPIIYVTHESPIPLSLTVQIEPWRTEPMERTEVAYSDLLFSHEPRFSTLEPVIVAPDVLLETSQNHIGWYHYNTHSGGFQKNIEIQGLSEFIETDPLKHRIFGALVTSGQAERVNPSTLKTSARNNGLVEIAVLTRHPSDPDSWYEDIQQVLREAGSIDFEERLRAHNQWWEAFWTRSYIHVYPAGQSEPVPGHETHTVSQAYALQRFITALSGRGAYPIKFNGSIFTVPAEGEQGDADFRRWGPGYWWMNTRLPYYAMPAAGDYDLMKPLFDMYAGEVYELSKHRTQKYFGIDGLYYPECIYFWGSAFTGDYGLVPFDEREDPLQESGWHKWAWGAGPEFVHIMQQYYDYTGDEQLLASSIIPIANDLLRFFDHYYQTGPDGVWIMHPSQALETWWDTTNPMPEVAGLRSMLSRLLLLPQSLVGEENRTFWNTMLARIPPIPYRDTPTGKALAPAERFEQKSNIENPELYAVFPYRHYAVGRPGIEAGLNALKHRWDSGFTGWRQDDLFMSYLGLADEVREQLTARASVHDSRFRFPAFWGPNYDWTPDQTHGAVLMRTLQSMLLQADLYSDQVHLLPAWPEQWNAEFRLHAPGGKRYSGRIQDGELTLFEGSR